MVIAPLHGLIWARCPKCGAPLHLFANTHEESGKAYLTVCLRCLSCGARYCLDRPFAEVE